jgi:hypothetical protein
MKLGQVIKIEQRGIAEYDRLATGCRSRPAASKINKTASMRSPRWGRSFDRGGTNPVVGPWNGRVRSPPRALTELGRPQTSPSWGRFFNSRKAALLLARQHFQILDVAVSLVG